MPAEYHRRTPPVAVPRAVVRCARVVRIERTAERRQMRGVDAGRCCPPLALLWTPWRVWRPGYSPGIPMPFVVSILQQKGGVGKTSLAASLFASRVCAGYSVGMFDLDPQGNATAWGIGHAEFNAVPQHAGAEAFTLPHGEVARGYSLGISPDDAAAAVARHVHPCARLGAGFVVPANLYMAPHDIADVRLDVLPFDVVVVDTPPRLPADVFRAIARQSDVVLAPVAPEAAAVQNVPDLIRELANCGGARLFEENAFRLVLTMVQKCTNHTAWQTLLREQFKPYISRVVISRATVWGELLNPSYKWNAKSAPAKAAAELWKEIERNAARRAAA